MIQRIKILIVDKILGGGMRILEESGVFDLRVLEEGERGDLKKLIGGYEGIIVRGRTWVGRELLECGKILKVIARAGVGVDNIDGEVARERGVEVLTAEEGGKISTVEHTIGLILCLSKKIGQQNEKMRRGVWDRGCVGMELYGKVLGVIGLGRIGREVGRRLGSGFGMEVIGSDPYMEGEVEGVQKVDIEEVYRRGQIITVHTSLSEKTKGLITKQEIGLMGEGTILINCARGGIMKEEDVLEGLKSGKLWGAGFDTFEKEPVDSKDGVMRELLDQKNFIGTAHIGGQTVESQERTSEEIARKLVNFFRY